MNVRLTGGKANVNWTVVSGHKKPYYGGASGWEHFLNVEPKKRNGETFTLWLEYSDGKQASDKAVITTVKDDCNKYLVLAVFTKLQERQ